MHDPVVLTDGHTYERRYIDQWLEKSASSPVSGTPLPSKTIIPNHALRNAIEEYFEGVLKRHRRDIQKTIHGLQAGQHGKALPPREFSAELVRTIDSLMQCSVLVNADMSIERVLKFIMEEAKSLIGAEVASVFLVDHDRQELFSHVNSTGGEIRIPLNSGIAGRVASSGTAERIRDAYANRDFNTEVDARTGFRTRNIMCVPIQTWKWGIFGVAELINKKRGGVAAVAPHVGAVEDMGFSENDQTLFQMLVSQAAVAIANSGWYDLEQERAHERSPSGVMGRVRSNGERLPALAAKTQPLDDISTSKGVATSVVALTEGRRGSGCAAHCSVQSPLQRAQWKLARPVLNRAPDCWEIDILSLAELTEDRALSLLGPVLIERAGLLDTFSLDRQRMLRFFEELERGYSRDVPYHNRAHATAVMHAMHGILKHGRVAEVVAANAADWLGTKRRVDMILLAGIFAAAIHDYEHAGLTNDFLIKTASKRALRYNDKSPNENHHVAAAFGLLQQEECNFLEGMPREENQIFRELVVDMVLGTDPKVSQGTLTRFKEFIKASGHDGHRSSDKACMPSTKEEAQLCLRLALNCADIGHLTMTWASHVKWVQRLEEEFFQQGDKEKKLGLPSVSFLMDREKPGVTETQVGFLDNVALPLFASLTAGFPDCRPLYSGIEANYQHWKATEAESSTQTSST